MATRWAEVVALLVLAWLVAVPLTSWFARAAWTADEPVAALLAWQAIGLSGGLAVLTAELTAAALDSGGAWRSGVAAVLRTPGSAGVIETIALIAFVLSLAWLLGVLVGSFARAARSRRAHRVLLELLSRPDRAHDVAFDVIDAQAPVAYSLPGRDPHVVLSTQARDGLTSAQLHAVLAHERAHLRQRHNLLVQPFIAWERSLPFLRSPRSARRRVEQLVEMVCDDAACAVADRGSLAAALAQLSPDRADVTERLTRLTAARHTAGSRAWLVAGAAALVIVPPALLLLVG
jgi:beta-lactamase regulating signal transducer with metallopeptidase domain